MLFSPGMEPNSGWLLSACMNVFSLGGNANPRAIRFSLVALHACAATLIDEII
jgi:hypothetical protein